MFIESVYTLPPDKLEKAIHLSRWHTALHFGDVAWTVMILWLLVRLRLGERIREWAASLTQKAWLQGFIVAPIWVTVLLLIGLPAEAISHAVSLHYGLSIQRWVDWFGDWALESLLMLLLGTLALSCLYALMRHSQRHWWLWFWLITMPGVVVGIYAVPIFIDPLFNHFSPLEKSDPALVAQLEKVVARGGIDIPPSRMFLMDASTKSTGVNAYVTGFGASKRIVVWDTALELASTDEILFIYGHEQGHYVLRHIVRGLIFSAGLIFVFYWIAFQLLRWLVKCRGDAWRIRSVEDWASVGLVLLMMTVLSFVSEPMANAFSRVVEHQADVYGQEVIHGLVADPQRVATQDFQRLGEVWLDNPSPNRFVEWWTYSHPSTTARMRFAAGYDPWTDEREPRYFRK
ncbi:M48 family metallopeptidase [Alloacidobacterium dinghuense]|uniref:M48 family metallopeptidase n=1 Tax=Alloacidobacterium dinghuense TaxID=2763107 RepID=A0A7G8BFM0_9BACT|nr:M48 family metallopeptidase [Alloacidobacterium dinghuense]QNI31340.1 M48 family metallopeptidase [Alloacidobacterium dinghuense]